MQADPQFLAETFHKVDSHGRGALSLPEFAKAYNIVYDHDPEQDIIYKKIPSSIVAIRYGLDKVEKRFIYEVYSGSTSKIVHKTCYFGDGTSAKYFIDRSFRGKPLPSQAAEENSNSNKELDLNFIVSLIDDDGKWNQMTGSNIMWWVDVCTKKIYPSKFIKAFSLPRSLEPMFKNEVFDNNGNKRLKLSHKTATEGDEHGFHHINSMNVFVQTLFLENKPGVNPHPTWLKYLPSFISRPIEYVSDKLAFMYDLDDVFDNEPRWSLERAERTASTFCEEAGLSFSKDVEPDASGNFLLSFADMKSRAPRLNRNTLSVHLLDRGAGVRCCLSFHRMEDESEVNSDAEKWSDGELAECGYVGRIVAGVRKKLKKVREFTIFLI